MSEDRKQLADAFAALSRAAADVCRALGGNPGIAAAGGPIVVTDADLDGPHGRPKIKVDPRDWKGDRFKGRTCDQCSPEFLDVYAETLDYFAQKAADSGNAQKAGYERRDAARVRAWATRMRNGWTPSKTNGAQPDDSPPVPPAMPGEPPPSGGEEDFE